MKRRLVAGMERGLARAAQLAGIDGDTEEELVIEAVAEIACSMAQAGQGADLVKLYGAMAYTEQGPADDGKSALDRALDRLPGLVGGAKPARINTGSGGTRMETATYKASAPDKVSGAPLKPTPAKAMLPGQTSMLDGLTGRPVPGGKPT